MSKISFLEKKTGKNLFDLAHTNFLLNKSLEAREPKAKMNYWDLINIKSFCTVKETVRKTKRQPTKWEKIFANDISDKGLVSKIYPEETAGQQPRLGKEMTSKRSHHVCS